MADETNEGGLTDAERKVLSDIPWRLPQTDLFAAVERIVAEREAARDAGVAHWRGRFERMRLMYRERFNEGLSAADWHAKHCAAQRAAADRDAAWAAKIETLAASTIEGTIEGSEHSVPVPLVWASDLRVLLTADHAKALDAVKAAAWDEGRRFGQTHWASNYWPEVPHREDPNPYRADHLTTDTP